MTRLSILWRTLTITKYPLAALSLKRGKGRKAITFRNGLICNLTWPQFRVFRDSYQLLAKYSISQVKDDFFRIRDQRSEVICNSQLMTLIFELMEDFAIIQEDEDIFYIRKKNFQAVGSKDILFCIQELNTGEYECDCQNKVVLDIGGFEGESAAYFWGKKAKKVIIYEPVEAHMQFIEKNIALNKINAEFYQAGIGNKNGIQIIHYNETNPGFGFLNKGLKSMEIKIRDVSEVIEESNAELAKFDCEGAEESLVHVPDKILRKIEYYLIEVHSPDIRKAILEKFQNASFILEKETPKPPQCSVLAFKRRHSKENCQCCENIQLSSSS
jgi:FkbM family methyltransferase